MNIHVGDPDQALAFVRQFVSENAQMFDDTHPDYDETEECNGGDTVDYLNDLYFNAKRILEGATHEQ